MSAFTGGGSNGSTREPLLDAPPTLAKRYADLVDDDDDVEHLSTAAA